MTHSSGSASSSLRGNGRFLIFILAAILFIVINIFAQSRLANWRLDLTEDGLYTLSDGTKQILEGIEEPITLTFYYSERLGQEVPSYGLYAKRVQDLLAEFVTLADSNLVLDIVKPEPFSDAEDAAVAAGLQGVPLDQSGEKVYFGLTAVNAIDGNDTISFFAPEREAFLEYDLAKIIDRLSQSKQPIIGLITSLPLEGQATPPMMGAGRPPASPWLIYQQLSESYQVQKIEPDATEIPEDVSLLMVIHPQGLSEGLRYAIDQYVLAGGHTQIYVDPHAEMQGGQPGMPSASNLPDLFKAWGVAYNPDQIIGDLATAVRVRASADSALGAVQYLAWQNLANGNIVQDQVITDNLDTVMVASTGSFTLTEQSGLTWFPLLQSTALSAPIDATKVRQTPDPEGLLTDFKPTGETYVYAARLSGKAKSAFPAGKPENVTHRAAHLSEAGNEVNLVIYADSDFLADRFWAQTSNFFGQQMVIPTADNSDLFLNSVDVMAGSGALISLRSRGVSARPFSFVDEMRREAESKFRAQEQALSRELQQAEDRLAQLQGQQTPEGQELSAVITPEQQQAIDQFKAQALQIRKELRNVQLALRQDIEALEGIVRFINIALIPILLTIFGLIKAIMVWRRRGQKIQTA